MEEIWRPIKEYEGYYEVSNLGRVRSIDRVVVDTVRNCERLLKGKVLIQRDNGNGYKNVTFCKEHKLYNKYVHRLVAEAFLPNPDNLPQVNHKDEDKSNNRVDNLEWCSQLYNNIYGSRMERQVNTRKLKNEHPELFKKEEKVKVERKKLTEEDKKAYQREYHKLHYEKHRIWVKERGNELRRKRRNENREEENRKQREYRRMKKLKKIINTL